MKLLISIILIIVTVLLNVILIVLSNKYKDSNINIKSKNISKSELITSLNKLLKKEIFIIAITLGFLVFFIENSNKIVSNVFFTLSILYSFICSILGIYNYNCFNNLLNKNSK